MSSVNFGNSIEAGTSPWNNYNESQELLGKCDIPAGYSSCTYEYGDFGSGGNTVGSVGGFTRDAGGGNQSGTTSGTSVYVSEDETPQTTQSTAIRVTPVLDVTINESIIATDTEPKYKASFEPNFSSDRDDSNDWQNSDRLTTGQSGSTFVTIPAGSSSGELFTQDFKARLPKGAEVTGLEVRYKYRVVQGSVSEEKTDLINCDYQQAEELIYAMEYDQGNNEISIYTLDDNIATATLDQVVP